MVALSGFLLTGAGVGIAGAVVDALTRNTTTPVIGTDTTDANGYYNITALAEGLYDIRITSGSDIIWRKYDTEAQMTTLDVANLDIRNPADTFVYNLTPGAITANRILNIPVLTATDTIAVLALAQTLTNKTLLTPVINTGVSGTAILDEDNMASDSATQLATQQSIKAYVDSVGGSSIFIPANSGFSDSAVPAIHGDWGTVKFVDGATDHVCMNFYLPFTPTRVDGIFFAKGTGNVRFNIDSDSGAIGEVQNFHATVPTITSVAFVTEVIKAVDLTYAIDTPTAGDFVGLGIGREGGHSLDTINADLHLIGLLIVP
jgi:hypothetical protein